MRNLHSEISRNILVTSMRKTPTSKSTAFLPAEPFKARFNPHRPPDHLSSELFGTDLANYSRKSIVSEFAPNFQPHFKYKPQSTRPRQQKRLFNPNQEVSRIFRRAADLGSLSWMDSRTECKKRCLPKSPSERKLDELSSSILNGESLRRSRAPPRPVPVDSENIHFIKSFRESVTQEASKFNFSPSGVRILTPQEMHRRSQRLSITPTPVPEAKLETFEITGLRPNEDVLSLKRRCSGAHLVSVQPEINNITGACTGRATISVRTSSSTEDVQLKLVQRGLAVSPISALRGKKPLITGGINLSFDSKQPRNLKNHSSARVHSAHTQGFLKPTISSANKSRVN